MKNSIIIILLLLGLQSTNALFAYAPVSSRNIVSEGISLQHKQTGTLKIKVKKNGLFYKLKQKLVRLGLKLIQNEGKDDRPFHWSAITALVCGALTLFTGLLFLPAIIFGAIGVFKTGPKKEYKGLGMSIAGLGLGLLIGALFILYIFYITRYL